MRQFDLIQSIKDSLDLLRSLTHPNMDTWNYCGVNLVTKKVEAQVLSLYLLDFLKKHKHVPQMAYETVMAEKFTWYRDRQKFYAQFLKR